MEISAYEIGAKRIHAEQLPTIAKLLEVRLLPLF
jgi:hypothetical protein